MAVATQNPHGEAELNPAHYSFYDFFDNRPEWVAQAIMGGASKEQIDEMMARINTLREALIENSSSVYGKLGQCAHCGTHIRYHVVYRDERDGSLLAIGQDCAENRLDRSPSEWKVYKDRLDRMRDMARRGEKLIALREQYPEAVEILEKCRQSRAECQEISNKVSQEIDALYPAQDDPYYQQGECADDDRRRELIAEREEAWKKHNRQFPDIIFDICGSVHRYGKMSDRQAEVVVKVFHENQERQKRIEEEKKNASPVPTGKGIEIVGEVVSVKWKENSYGGRLVMVVKHDDGWAVWGTVPSSIEIVEHDGQGTRGLERGDTVKFVANIEESDDETFGFFKRPRKAEIVTRHDVE